MKLILSSRVSDFKSDDKMYDKKPKISSNSFCELYEKFGIKDNKYLYFTPAYYIFFNIINNIYE